MDQLTERLVEYALTLSYEDLPPEVVERTKCLILDTVGCVPPFTQSSDTIVSIYH